MFKASQFLHGSVNVSLYTFQMLIYVSLFLEELPIRLAHRVKELEELPGHLSEMPSIVRVKNWYAQSFKVGQVGSGSSSSSTG